MIAEKMEEVKQNPFNSAENSSSSKHQFIDIMTETELCEVLELYFPIIKLDKKTYMIGVERKVIQTKNEKLFIKTLEGYIPLERYIKLECIDGSLQIEKTIRDLMKTFKQVVILHMLGHKATPAIISNYEAVENINQEIFLAIISRLRE